MHRENGQRRSRRTFWVSAIVALVGPGALAWYLFAHSEELSRLRAVSAAGVSVLSLLGLMTLGLSAVTLRFMVALFDTRISLLESFALTTTGGFINLLPLNTAQVFRAVYLRKVRGLGLIEFGLGSGAVVLVDFFSAGILGLIALHLPSLAGENRLVPFRALFLVFSLAPFVVLGLAMILRRSRWGKPREIEAKEASWLLRAYLSLIRSLDLMSSKPSIVVRLLATSVLSGIVRGLRFWFAATLLDYPVTFSGGIVLQSTSIITSFFTMLPGGAIGLREAIIGAGLKGLGGEAVSGVMISTVDRLVVTFWIILCGTGALLVLMRKSTQKLSSDQHGPGCSSRSCQLAGSLNKTSEAQQPMWRTATERTPIEFAPWPDGHAFALAVSHDVDRVAKRWQFLYYVAMALRRCSLGELRRQLDSLAALARGDDPYWNFQRIMALEDDLGIRSTFFFLNETGRATPLSPRSMILFWGRYSFDDRHIQDTICQLHTGGWEIGLHGSYASYRDEALLRREKEQLEAIVRAPVKGTRQHYLNLDVPNTWRIQAAVGFTYDSSLGFSDRPGFASDTSRPFYPKDPLTGLALSILVIPMAIMDAPLIQMDRSWHEALSLIDRTQQERGVLTMNWHQRLFNPWEFQEYQDMYIDIIRECQKRQAWIAPLGAIADWWAEAHKG